MNVLVIICKNGWMPVQLSEGWRRLGFSVEEFFYGTHMGKSSWSNSGIQQNCSINRQLISTAKNLKSKGKLDLIFAVIYDDVLTVETAKKLRSLNVPMVNYHVDLVGQWYRVLRTGKYFDLVACAQKDNWRGLKKAGIRTFYMPMAANPPELSQNPSNQFDLEGVLYLGSPWTYRKQILAHLAKSNVPLQIYGRNWQRLQIDSANAQPGRKNLHDFRHYLYPRLQQEGYSSLVATIKSRFKSNKKRVEGLFNIPSDCLKGTYLNEDFTSLVKSASINLGFTHFKGVPGTSSEQRQVRLREFEIPMHGGFYLTQSCHQLQELFPNAQSTASWDSIDDLKDKINYYLQNPSARNKVSEAVQNYCLEHHTWEHRFKTLLNELKLPLPISVVL